MKKVFLDTNFLMDYLFRDENKGEAIKALRVGHENQCRFYTSFLSIANFAYIMRKTDRNVLLNALETLFSLMEIIDNKKAHIDSAIKLNPRDFEDGIQYATAISKKCECIISRNKKDFSFSEIPILTPEEFVEHFN